MNWLRILYHLIVVWILVFIAVLLYITVYTSEWDNRVVYIYDELKLSEIEYFDN